MLREDKVSAVGRTKWFHSIDLGEGVVTPGLKSLKQLNGEADIIFKPSVDGRTVLDIGAWDGFFSLEAKRRGASRVLATDWYCWSGPGWGTKKGFEIAREATGLAVEDQEIDVPAISPDTVGAWDIVLFLGVLYHLKNPLDALERVAKVARGCLIVETYLERSLPQEKPAMMFYPGDELAKDSTNWWGPNSACVVSMLKVCGFTRIECSEGPHSRGIFHAHR